MRTRLTGAVLAGGGSTRMGRDKAFLPFGGGTLLDAQLARLRELGCDELIVSGRPGVEYPQPGIRVVHDDIEGLGPLGGLMAVLEAANHPLVFVVAVDLPCLTVPWLKGFLARGRSEQGVVLQGPKGFEPLVALYPKSALPQVRRAVFRSELSLQNLVGTLVQAGMTIPVPLAEKDRPFLLNWNRFEDLPPLEPGRSGG